MEEKILNILKSARAIQPSAQFVMRSRMKIFGAPAAHPPSFLKTVKREALEYLTFGMALALASALLIIIIGGLPYLDGALQRETASNQDLLHEAQSLEFDIQLSEAKYFNESAQEVATVLGRIQNSNTSSSYDDDVKNPASF